MDARWYNPTVGRFIQPDQYNLVNLMLPNGAQSELMRYIGRTQSDLLKDPAQQMRYGYVSGNALRWVDPLGLCEPVDAGYVAAADPNKKEDRYKALQGKIKNGDSLDAVEVAIVQQDLLKDGHDLGKWGVNKDGVDGSAGSQTKLAIEKELAPYQGRLVPVKLPGVGDTYLDRDFKENVEDFISSAGGKGVNVSVNSAYRTPEYQKNVIGTDPNSITPATNSLHSARLAIDVNYSSLSDIEGGLTGDKQREAIKQAANDAGISWGGYFNKPDKPHFYVDPGIDRKELIMNA
ncbi:M15 family metallopeptidase [Reinekea marina]|uniref:M15 family metallopeptidase n=1 Tax=Reinekea marina TaxID=1310421 RepID=A0ABV7WS31_9GAMM|nr:M15 family metallopeptidase [Reinekea marina]MDN3649177.1 M15 family metallopeptidase [Reinekea marina]